MSSVEEQMLELQKMLDRSDLDIPRQFLARHVRLATIPTPALFEFIIDAAISIEMRARDEVTVENVFTLALNGHDEEGWQKVRPSMKRAVEAILEHFKEGDGLEGEAQDPQ